MGRSKLVPGEEGNVSDDVAVGTRSGRGRPLDVGSHRRGARSGSRRVSNKRERVQDTAQLWGWFGRSRGYGMGGLRGPENSRDGEGVLGRFQRDQGGLRLAQRQDQGVDGACREVGRVLPSEDRHDFLGCLCTRPRLRCDLRQGRLSGSLQLQGRGGRRGQGGEEKGRENVAAEELDALPCRRNDGDEFARLGYGAPKAAGSEKESPGSGIRGIFMIDNWFQAL